MQYTWNTPYSFEMASIPKAAAEQLKLASALQLRVLVWLCCVGQGRFDAPSCAIACGGSPEACEESLRYWQAQDLIVLNEESAPTVAVAPAPVVAEPIAPPAEPTPTPVAPVLLPVQPTAAARPTRAEVLDVQASDPQFAFLLHTASQKLGKPLSPADMAVYLYLYKEVGLPPEVILMIIGYAVKNGKAKLSYIEKTALNWAEDGITTIAAADAHLCRMEKRDDAWKQVSERLSLDTPRPTVAQKETAYRWVFEWSFAPDVIDEVARYTVEKLGKFQLAYADRILERFQASDIRTVAAAKKELEAPQKPQKKRTSRMKTAEDRAPSFDIEQYESLAMRHRPRPPKQED